MKKTDKMRYYIVEVYPSGYRKYWPYRMTSSKALKIAITFTFISPENNYFIKEVND